MKVELYPHEAAYLKQARTLSASPDAPAARSCLEKGLVQPHSSGSYALTGVGATVLYVVYTRELAELDAA